MNASAEFSVGSRTSRSWACFRSCGASIVPTRIQARTAKFPTRGDRVLVGAGEENAGVIDIGDDWAVAFKMESHNHPSAIEPFQGAATG